MRWMIYRWWCEGGVIGHGGLFSACLGDLPPDMPKHLEKLIFFVQTLSSAFLGLDSPELSNDS